MTIRLRRTTAAAAGALLVVTGCSGELPTTQTPRAGLPVSVRAEQDVDRFLVPAREDAEVDEIVEGFLRANVGFDGENVGTGGENDVARTFLTSDLASRWVPTASVLVFEGSPQVQATAADEATVEVEVVGRIDAEGRLTEQAARTRTETFRLSQVGGEWRISEFPEGFGLWLSRTELERAFQPSTVFYLNPQRGYFVPEVRWLADGVGLPTALARAQLAPLPEHLEGAVRTAVTDGLRLASPSVPVDDARVATVNLRGATIAQEESVAEDLQSQLAHSLLTLPAVSGVQVEIAGQPLPLPDAEGPVTATTELPYSELQRDVDRALLRVGEELILVDPTQFRLSNLAAEESEGLDLPEVGLSWTGLAVSDDLGDVAAVNLDGSALRRWRGGETHTNEGIGDGLTAPAVDAQGAFWLAGVHRSSETPRVWVVDSEELDSVARPVEADWLRDDDRVHSLSVSPDGSRMLGVLGETEDTDHRVLLTGIIRDASGEPLGLTSPTDVAPSLVDVTVARWASMGEIVLVGQRPGDAQPRAFSLRLGEWLQPLGELPGLVDVLPLPRSLGARVIARTEDGGIFYPEGQRGWFPARNGDALVVPGG